MVTNFEYYSKLYPDLMIDILSSNDTPHNMLAYDITTDKVECCEDVECKNCKFSDRYNSDSYRTCCPRVKDWLKAEASIAVDGNSTKGEITW